MMKKMLYGILGIGIVFLTFGCGKVEEKTLTCTLDRNDVINGYQNHSTYTAYIRGDIVTKVETIEEVTSDTQELADYFEEISNTTYAKMNHAYGGYTYTVTNQDQVVTSHVTIDYTQMNLEQLVQDEPTMKSFLNDQNEMTNAGIQAMYEQMGATCKYEK